VLSSALQQLHQELRGLEWVTSSQAIPNAKVPVIKLAACLAGWDVVVDISFAGHFDDDQPSTAGRSSSPPRPVDEKRGRAGGDGAGKGADSSEQGVASHTGTLTHTSSQHQGGSVSKDTGQDVHVVVFRQV
jgi:hypothetical protein